MTGLATLGYYSDAVNFSAAYFSTHFQVSSTMDADFWLPPQAPEGLAVYPAVSPDESSAGLACGEQLEEGHYSISWFENTEDIFDHYEYQLTGQEEGISTTEFVIPVEQLALGDYGFRVRSVGANDKVSDWSEWCEYEVVAKVLASPSPAPASGVGGASVTDLVNGDGEQIVQLGGVSADESAVSVFSQQLDTSAGLDKFSFWYQFVTFDSRQVVDEPGMMVFIDGQVVYQEWASDLDRTGAAPYGQGWKKIIVDVTALKNPTLTVAFYGGVSTSPELASYVYLDQIGWEPLAVALGQEPSTSPSPSPTGESPATVITVAKWPLFINEAWIGESGPAWIELSNPSLLDVDLTGWTVRNRQGRKLSLSSAKLDNDLNLNTQEGVLKANDFLVIYDDQNFFSKQSELVSLYDAQNELVSSLELSAQASLDQSYGLQRDSQELAALLATPGRKNAENLGQLEPSVVLWSQSPSTAFFSLFDGLNYQIAEYILSYQYGQPDNLITEAMTGQLAVSDLRQDVKDLKFATCSTGGECALHAPTKVDSIKLQVILKGEALPEKTFETALTGGWLE